MCIKRKRSRSFDYISLSFLVFPQKLIGSLSFLRRALLCVSISVIVAACVIMVRVCWSSPGLVAVALLSSSCDIAHGVVQRLCLGEQVNGKADGAFAVDQESVLSHYGDLVVAHLVRFVRDDGVIITNSSCMLCMYMMRMRAAGVLEPCKP